jgi:Glyoxalase-like domain
MAASTAATRGPSRTGGPVCWTTACDRTPLRISRISEPVASTARKKTLTSHWTPSTGRGPAFWFNQVPEPKTAKNRVHIDVFGDVDELLRRGATMIDQREESRAGFQRIAPILRVMPDHEPGAWIVENVATDPCPSPTRDRRRAADWNPRARTRARRDPCGHRGHHRHRRAALDAPRILRISEAIRRAASLASL